jgi:multiple sugar transport system substrate-binding protein
MLCVLAGAWRGAAQQSSSAKPIAIDVWFHSGTGNERDEIVRSLQEFNASRADITVKLIELPEGQSYNEQVQAAAYGAAIAGNLPCLLEFDGPNAYNYIWNGFLIPLDPYVPEEMRQDFLPSILAQGTFQDGKLYNLGLFDSGLAIWGNKKYLAQAGVRFPTVADPWMRAEFEAALAKLQALPEVTYALDLKMNYGIGEWFTYGFSPILQSFGADLIDRTDYQHADGVLNGPAAIAAMEMVQGWFQKRYVNPAPSGDTDFIDGKTALSWVGFWNFAPYREALGDNLVLLPMPDFGKGPKTGMGSWCWGITTTCEHPEAAWEVLRFLLQPERLVRFSKITGAIPARKSAFEHSEWYGRDGFLRVYIDQIEAGFAVPRPITPAYPAITLAFAEAFNNIARGADVKSELDHAVQKIEQDITAHNGYPLKK